MVDKRSNAFVEAMNGFLQQAKRAARGFRTAASFIAIAYLRMTKLSHLPLIRSRRLPSNETVAFHAKRRGAAPTRGSGTVQRGSLKTKSSPEDLVSQMVSQVAQSQMG
jgi:hypothetical protein